MPIIQLSFDNPLNTSVQVGDNAYFSNPLPVSSVGNPLGGPWTSTTTPHMTNDIDGVVDLGEILTITPWNGTNSFITCDMDQVLFNKYFPTIQAPVCTTVFASTGGGATVGNSCSYHLPVIDLPPTPELTTAAGTYFIDPNANVYEWFYDNPSVNINDPCFHTTTSRTITGGCLVDPTANPMPYYDPALNNYWYDITLLYMRPNANWNGDINGNDIYLYDNSIPGFTSIIGTWSPGVIPFGWAGNSAVTGIPLGSGAGGASNSEGNNFQSIIDWVNTNFPGVTNPSMSYHDFIGAILPYGITVASQPGGPLLGTNNTVVVTTTTCVGNGSYIMFSKDNKANMSSILGYYASVEYRNSSQIKSELFNVGTDFFESSK